MNTLHKKLTELAAYLDGFVSRDVYDAEVAALKAKLEDIEDAHGVVMDERCGADEVHCTCVPALRYEVAALKAKLEAVDLGDVRDARMVAAFHLWAVTPNGWESRPYEPEDVDAAARRLLAAVGEGKP